MWRPSSSSSERSAASLSSKRPCMCNCVFGCGWVALLPSQRQLRCSAASLRFVTEPCAVICAQNRVYTARLQCIKVPTATALPCTPATTPASHFVPPPPPSVSHRCQVCVFVVHQLPRRLDAPRHVSDSTLVHDGRRQLLFLMAGCVRVCEACVSESVFVCACVCACKGCLPAKQLQVQGIACSRGWVQPSQQRPTSAPTASARRCSCACCSCFMRFVSAARLSAALALSTAAVAVSSARLRVRVVE